jgi:hypothetical protein
MAQLFKEVIEEEEWQGYFKHIAFAIIGEEEERRGAKGVEGREGEERRGIPRFLLIFQRITILSRI